MLRGSNAVKWRQWTERLERFAKSGQTVSEFCRAEGVSSPSFYKWRQRLASVRGQQKKQPQNRRGKSSAFKRLHVSPADVSSGVSVRLPDGIVVELGSDLQTIERIVAQVLNYRATGAGSC